MATRSMIGAMFDKSVDPERGIVASYCHYDGYLTGVGMTLFEYFRGDDAFAVADFGYMSSLSYKSVDELFEGASSHANSGDSTFFKNIDEFFDDAQDCGCEFAYLWIDDEWCWTDDFQTVKKMSGKVFIPGLKYAREFFVQCGEKEQEQVEFYEERIRKYSE